MRKLIDPGRESTPVATGGFSTPRPLPPDILEKASRRLGALALIGVALWLTAPLLHHLSSVALGDHVGDLRLMALVAGSNVLLSLGLFLYSRRAGEDPGRVLDIGLVYLIVTSFSIGLIWHLRPAGIHESIQPMITWVGPLLLLFAALVPNSPGKMLAAGLTSASMVPLGMLIARSRGTWAFESAIDVLLMHYPDFMLAGVALAVSGVVTGLGQQVARARALGSYQLGELLGEGGMGRVYRATHRLLARPAAIKLIRPEMLGGGNGAEADLAVKRFKREALAAANLRSPHTVELYDFGITDDQTFYFVMELLDGMTLDELVRETGPVPPGRVVYLLEQVCESLEEAHRNGLVHRDIKPANIHVGRLGLRHDFVKVLDFGLVKSTSADGDRSMATAAGLTPGTPAFMAPEVALGDPIDGRADLYALGCVAYYLLTGRPVFEGENAFQMVAKHLNAEPDPPSRHAPRKIPEALDRLVLRCLTKAPADRPASAAEVAQALSEIEVDPWGEEEARKWWSERLPQSRASR